MAYKWHALPIDAIETQIRAVEASFSDNAQKLSARCFCNEIYNIADGYGLFDFTELWTWFERLHITSEEELYCIAKKAEHYKIIKSVTLLSGEVKYICEWWYGFIGDKQLPFDSEARLELFERMSVPKTRKAETMEQRRERVADSIAKSQNDKKAENVATVYNNNINTNIDIDKDIHNNTYTTTSQNITQTSAVSNPDESASDQHEFNQNLKKSNEQENNVDLNSRNLKYLRKSEFHLSNFFIQNAPRNFDEDAENLKALVDLAGLCVKLGNNHKKATTECVTLEMIAAIKTVAQDKVYTHMPLEPKNVWMPQYLFCVFEKMQDKIGDFWNKDNARKLYKILYANLQVDIIQYGGKLFPEWGSAIAGTTPEDSNWYKKYNNALKDMQRNV